MKRKRVLVTGGSRGIGQAIAEQLRREGYEVVAPSHKEMDLNSTESISRFVQRYSTEGFDCIVNNAGINEINNVENIPEDELARTLAINLVAPILLIKSFVPQMKSRGYGRIVNIGSIWGIVSKGGRLTYSASKHGIHGVTKTLAVELAPFNILVNTVSPGFTLTELTRKNNSEEQISEICKEIPMGRMAEPKEIADIVCYLISERNTYITGQMIAVDGGFTSK